MRGVLPLRVGVDAGHVYTLSERTTRGRITGVSALFAEGGLVVGSYARYDANKPVDEAHQTHLAIVDPDTGDIQQIPHPPNHGVQRQAGSAAIGKRHIVWTETPSIEMGAQPWVMYAYDLRTHRSTVLGHSHPVHGRPAQPPPNFSGLSFGHQTVVWAQVDPMRGGSRGVIMNLYGYDFAAEDPAPRLLVRNGFDPVNTPAALFYLKANISDPTMPRHVFEIHRRDWGTGKD
ncbi:MAG: hypothetical protein ACRDQA_17760, partial [Nocardioidaceae bacterium]